MTDTPSLKIIAHTCSGRASGASESVGRNYVPQKRKGTREKNLSLGPFSLRLVRSAHATGTGVTCGRGTTLGIIIHVKVDGLERSKQHWNMHRLSTCDRDRRVTDTVPQTRSQISEVRRARADSVRSLRQAAMRTLPPQCHS